MGVLEETAVSYSRPESNRGHSTRCPVTVVNKILGQEVMPASSSYVWSIMLTSRLGSLKFHTNIGRQNGMLWNRYYCRPLRDPGGGGGGLMLLLLLGIGLDGTFAVFIVPGCEI